MLSRLRQARPRLSSHAATAAAAPIRLSLSLAASSFLQPAASRVAAHAVLSTPVSLSLALHRCVHSGRPSSRLKRAHAAAAAANSSPVAPACHSDSAAKRRKRPPEVTRLLNDLRSPVSYDDAEECLKLLRPLLLSAERCLTLPLSARVEGRRGEPSAPSLLRVALDSLRLLNNRSKEDAATAATALRHLHSNIEANGFDHAADPAAWLAAIDLLSHMQQKGRMSSSPPRMAEHECASRGAALASLLLRQSGFSPKRLLSHLPEYGMTGFSDMDIWTTSPKEQPYEEALGDIWNATRNRASGRLTAEGEELLQLFTLKCQPLLWRFDSWTGLTLVHELLRSRDRSKEDTWARVEESSIVWNERSDIESLLRAIIAAPNLATLPITHVGQAEEQDSKVTSLITAARELAAFDQEIHTPRRLCVAVLETVTVWQAAQGDDSARAAMEAGSEEERQLRRRMVEEEFGAAVTSLSESQLRDRLVRLQSRLPQLLAARRFLHQSAQLHWSEAEDLTPLLAPFEGVHLAIAGSVNLEEGAGLNHSVGRCSASVRQRLLFLPTEQLEQLAPLEPLLLRTESNSQLQSVEPRFLIALYRPDSRGKFNPRFIPHSSDSFAWRFWHASLQRVKLLAEADAKTAAEAEEALEWLLTELYWSARSWLDNSNHWSSDEGADRLLQFVRLICDTLHGSPLNARQMWHKLLTESANKQRIERHQEERVKEVKSTEWTSRDESSLQAGLQLLQRWLDLCPDSASALLVADGKGEKWLCECDEELSMLKRRFEWARDRSWWARDLLQTYHPQPHKVT